MIVTNLALKSVKKSRPAPVSKSNTDQSLLLMQEWINESNSHAIRIEPRPGNMVRIILVDNLVDVCSYTGDIIEMIGVAFKA